MNSPVTSLTDAEVAVARAVTPGCDPVLGIIHLNHAGAALVPQVVLDAHVDHLLRESMIGGYEAADEAADRSADVYESLARLVRARPHEIARFESSTAAWNAAFWSVPMETGQRILVHHHEYGANAVAFIRAAETRGVVIERVPSDSSGQVSVDEFAARVDRGNVALASLTHVPTNGGLVNPAAEIGSLTSAAEVPYLVDGCQSIGQRDIDVGEIGCDFYAASGRKFLRGPRGTGFLYVRDSILGRVAPSQPDHWGAELTSGTNFEWMTGARRFEHFEHSVAGWLGLGAAVDHALGWGTDRIEATVAERAEQLRAMLTAAGFTIYDLGDVRSGIVTTAIDRVSAGDLRRSLQAAGINASLTHPSSSPYDVEQRHLPTLLRLSVHYTTTPDELSTAVGVLRSRL